MVERYARIRDQIKQVEAVFDLIPRRRCISALRRSWKTSEDLSVADERVLFD
ncbi:hypothetical protein V7S43_018544 [Phytophthora oleae]|uniref:DDE Tnp4 domain-containing protein n=1 Tax=Phytophthora oleae TaxID=2107226 RepID=A0ABD3ER17_9STRA